MTDLSQQLQIRIMRRVYIIYWYRRVTNPVTLKLSALATLGVLSFTIISVRSVVVNVSHTRDFWSACQYLFDAFTKTEVPVQAMVVGGIIFMGIVAKDAFGQLRERVPLPFFLGFK